MIVYKLHSDDHDQHHKQHLFTLIINIEIINTTQRNRTNNLLYSHKRFITRAKDKLS